MIRRERPARRIINRLGRNRNRHPLRVTQRRQVSAVGASRIDIDGVIQPHRRTHGRVPVHHQRLAAIPRRPDPAHVASPLRSFSPVKSPCRAKARAAAEERPCSASVNPACAITSRPSSSTRWLGSSCRKSSTAARKLSGSVAIWSRVRAMPRVTWAAPPRSTRTSSASRLPAMQSAVPTLAMLMASRSTPGAAGPAVHQISHKSQRPPVRRSHRKLLVHTLHAVAHGLHQSQQLVQATVHVAHHVERPTRLAQRHRISHLRQPVQQSGFPLRRWPCLLPAPRHRLPV